MFNNVTVILRESGERTADTSFGLLTSIFPSECLHRIQETPFSEAIRTTFEIGKSENRPWTLCIDADVLICSQGLKEMQIVAELQDHRVFEVQGYVADKFFGHFRPAGNHLYRTSLLDKAIQLIPQDGKSLRPESTVISAMEELGNPALQLPTVVGIHDFEQFYIDIYRKCFLQSQKHDWLSDFLRERWNNAAVSDKDFRVAALGFEAGHAHGNNIRVDKFFLREEHEQHLAKLQIEEKNDLGEPWTHEQVNAVLHDFLCETSSAVAQQQAILTNHYFAKPVFKCPRTAGPRPSTLARRVFSFLRRLQHRVLAKGRNP